MRRVTRGLHVTLQSTEGGVVEILYKEAPALFPSAALVVLQWLHERSPGPSLGYALVAMGAQRHMILKKPHSFNFSFRGHWIRQGFGPRNVSLVAQSLGQSNAVAYVLGLQDRHGRNLMM
jgi:hypothetical protein